MSSLGLPLQLLPSTAKRGCLKIWPINLSLLFTRFLTQTSLLPNTMQYPVVCYPMHSLNFQHPSVGIPYQSSQRVHHCYTVVSSYDIAPNEAMKRRILSMDTYELPTESVALVERNSKPQGVELVSSYTVGRREPSDLVSLAHEIQKADSFVQATTSSKLQMIAEQIRFLQQQAERVLLEAKQSIDLHHAACNFRKIPGCTYYLYERPSGQHYFSMLSPEDWQGHNGPPHTYIGAYRLEKDMSWTPAMKVKQQNDSLRMNEIVSVNFIGSCDGRITHTVMDES